MVFLFLKTFVLLTFLFTCKKVYWSHAARVSRSAPSCLFPPPPGLPWERPVEYGPLLHLLLHSGCGRSHWSSSRGHGIFKVIVASVACDVSWTVWVDLPGVWSALPPSLSVYYHFNLITCFCQKAIQMMDTLLFRLGENLGTCSPK